MLWFEPGGGLARFDALTVEFAAIGYAYTVLLGVPGGLLIRRWKLRAAWQLTRVGAALGGLGCALLPLVPGTSVARRWRASAWR